MGGSAGYGSDVVLVWLWLLLWCRFDPWTGNFHMTQVSATTEKKEKETDSLLAFTECTEESSPGQISQELFFFSLKESMLIFTMVSNS